MKKSPLVIAGGQTSQLQAGDWIGPKNNSALIAPAVSNDDTQGYEVQSRWTDTALGKEYVCVDATTGAAVWVETTGGGGGGFSGLTEFVLNSGTGNIDSIPCGTSPLVCIVFTGAAPVVEGIAAGASGKRVVLKKVGAGNLVIKQNGSGTAANNLALNTGADITLLPNESIELLYTSAGPFWIHVSSAIVPSGGGGGAVETTVIYEPSIGATTANRYKTWTEVMAAVAALIGPVTIQLRNPTPGLFQVFAVSDAGPHNIKNCRITTGTENIFPILQFADGVTLSGYPRETYGIIIETLQTTAPLYTVVDSFEVSILNQSSIRSGTTATQPVIAVPATKQFSLFIDGDTSPIYKNGGGLEPIFCEGILTLTILHVADSSLFGLSDLFTNGFSGLGTINIDSYILLPGGYTATHANYDGTLILNQREEQRVQELITASALPATILYVHSSLPPSPSVFNSLAAALSYANSIQGRKIIYLLSHPNWILSAGNYNFDECEVYNRVLIPSPNYSEALLQFGDGTTITQFPVRTDVKFFFSNSLVPVCTTTLLSAFEFCGWGYLRNAGSQPIIVRTGTQNVTMTLRDEAYIEAVGAGGVVDLSSQSSLSLRANDRAQVINGSVVTSGNETEYVTVTDNTLRPGGLNVVPTGGAIITVTKNAEARVNELITARNLAATITTPTRALNTAYINGNKPRAVSVSVQLPFSAAAESAAANLNVAGNLVQMVRAPRVTLTGFDSNSNPTNPIYSMFGIVPPGSNYQVTDVGSTGGLVPVILAWYEQELSL